MAIENHENPNQEIKPKSRRITGGGEPPEEEDNQWPPWLKPLLKEHFFVQCIFHTHSPKNECNMYCLDCTNGSLCSLCLQHHKDHRTVQIRRSSYHDVIRVNEIKNHLDIMTVQTYVINNAKVVFLNERPQHKPPRTPYACVCSRGLVDDCFSFCSLGCKVAGTSRSFEKGVKDSTVMASESTSNTSGVVEDNIQSPQSLISSTPQVLTSGSFRKRPRKGIPYRSPLQ